MPPSFPAKRYFSTQYTDINGVIKEKLAKKKINLENLNLLVDKKEFEKEILVKVRSTGKLLDAKINLNEKNSADVNLKVSEDGISPGQACVFYKKDNFGFKVLGGGWIKS